MLKTGRNNFKNPKCPEHCLKLFKQDIQEELSNDPNFGSSKPPEQGFDKNWLCKYGIEIFD